ncbi:toll/interleukin-1 receptor domain-containing protein [Limnohabitans sp.]|uniref:toll/interleukin-1 receptor domain-containing protein n=1 Tax=Limnohabitans sp. TaxID=1907725 RepID=UPI0037BF8830
MILSTRPFLVLYVVWHPAFDEGQLIAKKLYEHYRRELYSNVAGGAGLSVIYRPVPDPITLAPVTIDFSESETSAVVMLIDECFAGDDHYVAWSKGLMSETDAVGLSTRVFPIAINSGATRMGFAEQAVRWDRWVTLDTEARLRRLTADLTYQFCRMLRFYLEHLHRPDEEEAALEQYLKKVQIFLSHSKHDKNGERIAKEIRQHIFNGDGLATFFDVHDIPTGVRFDKVLLHQVKSSAVVAIHTDSFSSREWCRREIIEAKRWSVPLVVADCISDTDERGFPYMGNVPVVRMDPVKVDRIDNVIARLLDEVLKDFLWRCRVQLVLSAGTVKAAFLPRSPELVSLAALSGHPGEHVLVVYPDPPLGAEEQRLFEQIAPRYQLRSLTEFLAIAEGVE